MLKIQCLNEVNTALPGRKWEWPDDDEARTYIDPSKVQFLNVFNGLVQDNQTGGSTWLKLIEVFFDNGHSRTIPFAEGILEKLTNRTEA